MRVHIGIDPGLSGAVAILIDDGSVQVYDTPTCLIKAAKRDFSGVEMSKLLGPFAGRDDVVVALEAVHSFPGEGVSSAFSFGRGVGIWEGILSAYRIRYARITPQKWKAYMMDGCAKEKNASILEAQRHFPKVDLSLKKHHGRADALLLAEYSRRTYDFQLKGELI
jgi:hypothetical protein